MIAFFDTNVHIDVLRGTRSLAEILVAIGNPPVRLSPVVASELLRGVSGRGARSVMRLVRGLVTLEPPSWRSCWLETGRLLLRIFSDHEALGLARLHSTLSLLRRAANVIVRPRSERGGTNIN